MYNSPAEDIAIRHIRNKFPAAEIINPVTYRAMGHADMKFYYTLVDSCDAIIYISIADFLTAGVAEEIKRGLKEGKEIYKLDWRTGEIWKVKKLNEDPLDLQTTRQLYTILDNLDIDEVQLQVKIREKLKEFKGRINRICLLYTSPSPRDRG